MERYIELTQYDGNYKNLNGNDYGFFSGDMSWCVTVVVLWKKNGDNYINGRGWHGPGGLGAVDFEKLLDGIPNTIDSLILVIPGHKYPSGFNDNDESINNTAWKEARQKAGYRTIRQERCSTNVLIKRTGEVVYVDRQGQPLNSQGNRCLPRCNIL